MAIKRIGSQTVKFQNPPSIISTYTIVGPKEGEGPLKDYFDMILEDDMWGQESFEKSEAKIQEEAIKAAISNGKLTNQDMDYLLAGDLLNQIVSSTYSARSLSIPYYGLFGACSTMTESLSLGAMLIDGGFADNLVCATSSHFSSAERQFRFPLEYGNQRKFSAQWTVTGSGATVLSANGNGPYITYATTGKIIDMGVKEADNMGAAMAPAAIDTLLTHFKDTGYSPKDYDLIVSGDLGKVGKAIVLELMKKEGYDLTDIYTDCGVEVFDIQQDTHAGGSGCGCAAVVLNGYIYKEMMKGKFSRVLVMATGALHSPTMNQQGESIPGIAHAITIDVNKD
ncbi:stage V sporulation protein AD [Tissierella pigra]|uniref:Stage V sporulation protein AD n=1 Tax=Tissierella pigra TaxID=2607614 RepID=A0A6N7XLY6_9FIRM|nr:stage V sporulation protein AD [Tissierella pigra]MBU5427061.1 stage V sporulation protein AD [Tissierella pigra]MSU01782.1 stage V sporulation protein AD [Tissierella pigra]